LLEIGIPELDLEKLTDLTEGAEKIAREYLLSKIKQNKIIDLEIIVNAEGTKPVTLKIDINLILSPLMQDFNVKKLVKESTNRSFEYIEDYLRELKCK
jgi:hypothetical protein